VGMVRLFAKEATAAIGTVLGEARGRPPGGATLGALLGGAGPLFEERTDARR